MSFSFAALVLSAGLLLGLVVLHEEDAEPLQFDPVSSLAISDDPVPVLLLPTNAHPYPEALAQPPGLTTNWTDDLAGAESASDAQMTTEALSGARPLIPGSVVGGLLITAEQLNVARYFADRYRRPLDRVVEVVACAYLTAREARVDPLLVLSVIAIESGFNPHARNLQGAEGLMQVRTTVHEEKFLPFGGARAAFDPEANIRVGVQILRDYLLREGSVEAALKAYVGAARRRHDGGYGLKVMRERDQVQQALAAQVQDELASSGSSVSRLFRPL